MSRQASRQPPPIPAVPAAAAVPVLNYAGPAVPQRPAFNVRRTWMWRGEHLFRVYLTAEEIYFIRIGGARNQELVLASQFGLLGGLMAWILSKNRKKKEAKRLLENEVKTLDVLLAEHKRNHVFRVRDVMNPAIEAMGRRANPLARWTFDAPGEKKRVTCVFDKTEDVHAAIARLSEMFSDLKVKVEFDAQKKKFRKIA